MPEWLTMAHGNFCEGRSWTVMSSSHRLAPACPTLGHGIGREIAMDAGNFKSDQAFESIIEHWAKARMDSAIDAIARYDESAKQLIGLGGALQGVYVVGFAFGNIEDQASNDPMTLLLLAGVAVSVLLVIFFAARCVCTVHLRSSAFSTYELMLSGRNHAGLEMGTISDAMRSWCAHIDDVADRKRKLLQLGNSFFIATTGFVLFALARIIVV